MVAVIPDYTLLVQMATFIALIVILNFLLYRPILSIMERRKKQLDELDNEVRLFKESVDKKVSEYEEKLAKAKASASDLKKDISRFSRLSSSWINSYDLNSSTFFKCGYLFP